MLKYDFVDPARVFVVGLSNGGGTSPVVPRQHRVRGYIAASSWGRTGYENMLELERVRLSASDENPGAVNSDLKAFTDFYSLYLIQGMSPEKALHSSRSGRASGTTLRMGSMDDPPRSISNFRR